MPILILVGMLGGDVRSWLLVLAAVVNAVSGDAGGCCGGAAAVAGGDCGDGSCCGDSAVLPVRVVGDGNNYGDKCCCYRW